MVIAMSESISHRALVWLAREKKRAQHALWHAVERNAPQEDIENLKNKLEVLEHAFWAVFYAPEHLEEDEDEDT